VVTFRSLRYRLGRAHRLCAGPEGSRKSASRRAVFQDDSAEATSAARLPSARLTSSV
jgi:hypothetical protein